MENTVRILLVEDDSSIVMFLKDFLIKEGFRIDNTDTQAGALSCLEEKNMISFWDKYNMVRAIIATVC